MVRRARVEIEGGLYHVYNRVASGEAVFSDPEVAIEFIEVIRETKARDGRAVASRGADLAAAERLESTS